MTELQGPDGATGLVASQLTLAAAAARPGDTVTALLQVSCSQPEAVELQEVEIDFSGIERIDTSWVQPTWRRDTPPINADKRKVQRYVVQSRLQAATQGTFSDLSLRRFVVRFTLPTWLPPTFRGTAVRYLYYLQAVVRYRAAQDHEQQGEGSGGSSKSNGTAQAAGGVATRIPLHIWPAKHQLEGSAGGPALPGAAQAEDMPIKCWEIGPGTAVQDAVAHIAKLASQPPQPTQPHSPAGRLAKSSAAAGLPGAGSSTAGDDSRSEISHDPQDGEQQPEEMPGSGSSAEPAASGAAAGAAPPKQLAQQQQQERQPQQATPPSSGASTPRSKPPAQGRRPSLARPSLDQGAPLAVARSPLPLADSGSTLRSFALRMGDQPLARVSLHPPLEGSLQPGSTLTGTLDFAPQLPLPVAGTSAAADGDAKPAGGTPAGPGPRCVQVLILLETEEVVEAPWRRQLQGGGSGAIRRVHDEHLEVTADTACTHFMFTIPPDAAASFQTQLLQLRWLLRFQFTASLQPARPAGAATGAVPAGQDAAAQAPDWNPLQGKVEQLVWALPVTVLPPAP